jgi:hypothetical protein
VSLLRDVAKGMERKMQYYFILTQYGLRVGLSVNNKELDVVTPSSFKPTREITFYHLSSSMQCLNLSTRGK